MKRAFPTDENRRPGGYTAAGASSLALFFSRKTIPTLETRKHQRSVDDALYRQRNLVERFFNKFWDRRGRPGHEGSVDPANGMCFHASLTRIAPSGKRSVPRLDLEQIRRSCLGAMRSLSGAL